MKQETKKKSIRAVLVLAVAAALLAADQIIKYFILQYLKPVGQIGVIPNLLELSYVENKGAAFGLFANQIWFVVLITAIATVAIIVMLFSYRNHTFFSYATSALFLAGGFGNLMDRILYGYVVDYIHVMFFPYVFNLADCCITVGAALFVIHYICASKKAEKRQAEIEKKEENGEDNAPDDAV